MLGIVWRLLCEVKTRPVSHLEDKYVYFTKTRPLLRQGRMMMKRANSAYMYVVVGAWNDDGDDNKCDVYARNSKSYFLRL